MVQVQRSTQSPELSSQEAPKRAQKGLLHADQVETSKKAVLVGYLACEVQKILVLLRLLGSHSTMSSSVSLSRVMLGRSRIL